MLTALVLLGGKGVSIAAPNGAVLCAGGWSVGVLAWVKEIKAGEAEREKSASSAEENEGALGDGKSEKRALATPQVLSRRFRCIQSPFFPLLPPLTYTSKPQPFYYTIISAPLPPPSLPPSSPPYRTLVA